MDVEKMIDIILRCVASALKTDVNNLTLELIRQTSEVNVIYNKRIIFSYKYQLPSGVLTVTTYDTPEITGDIKLI